MCFTPEISLVTLFTGLTGSYLLYNINNIRYKILGGFLGYVSLMQLIEFLLWSHQTCDDYHKKVSFTGMLLNVSQPVVLALLILYFNPVRSPVIIATLVTYFAFVVGLYIPQYTSDLHCTKPRQGDPHLVWNWLILENYELWWIFYIATSVILILYGVPKGLTFALPMTGTMLASIFLYPRQVMGSMWCFFTALSPMVMYLSSTWH
jgi:hypothetical protein